MNPPAIPKGLLGVFSKQSEDGGELIRSDATLVKRRGRPSRKEVMDVEEAPLSPKASTSTFPNATEKLTQPIEQPGVACLAPKRPHSQTKATDSSSLTAGQTSQSVNGYVQESDTGIAKLDSNNNNDNAPASLVYLQNNGQLVPVVAMPQTPPNYIDDIVAVGFVFVAHGRVQGVRHYCTDVEEFDVERTAPTIYCANPQRGEDGVQKYEFLPSGSRRCPAAATLEKVSTSEILRVVGNLFTRTADEKGGREKRQEDAALKKIAFEEYKKSHPEKIFYAFTDDFTHIQKTAYSSSPISATCCPVNFDDLVKPTDCL
ncbi:uncharacterized protein LOC116917645 [Daphnia magna]|uniref:uncharacterized protein LOC116917645 n=1 Tax=Daphnia magna TaxID=35525 RepID=UPI001E1BB404|nr:uncharacterized protein LOC116917645 [Daphnia magna]